MVASRASIVLLATCGLLASLPVLAQDAGALVVLIPGDSQFHAPACALVARAGSKVKVSKRGEAVRRGLKAHVACFDGASTTAPAADPNAATVVTQAGDNKYHRASCKRVGTARTSLTLEQAGRKFWPCPVCKPPIRQRKPQ